MEGVVAKIYKKERPDFELARTKSLITVCRMLDPVAPATHEWFARLNLPLRPILSINGRFGGVFLPPIPSDVEAIQYEFDHKARRLVPTAQKTRFEAQFLTRKMSPVGPTTDLWQWRILHSLCETVAMMHSANLVHGDLSMSNVLVRQVDATHQNDSVYLIDIDDAFRDSGKHALSQSVRRSHNLYDPYSVSDSCVSKDTDVFVVALWIIAFMQYEFASPASATREIPSRAKNRLDKTDRALSALVSRSLGPLGSRPDMIELYLSIREVAQCMGAGHGL